MSNIKAAYRYIDEDGRYKFSNSRCLLTISVGQEVHESEKFATTVDLINRSFKSCILLIDDSLQRHTMALDREESPDDLHEISIMEGDRWLVRNEKYYSQLDNLNKIIRWDMWLNHANYQMHQSMLKSCLQNDKTYHQIFNETINEFLRRYCNRVSNQANFDQNRAHQLCFDYLLEECTAMTLWPELTCHFEVYPSKRNFAMQETHSRFVMPYYPELLHAVAIKFKNRKQLKPQQFNLIVQSLENGLAL